MFGTCSSCKQPIVWAYHHKTALAMPFDMTPDPKGKWVIVKGLAYPCNAVEGGPRHMPHFATCRFAEHHRKATRKRSKK